MGCRLRCNRENVREEGKLTAFFQGASTSPPSKTYQERPAHVTSGSQFLPSAKMTAGARSYHGARVVPPVRPLPVLPRAGTAHSPAAPPPSVLSLTPFLAAPAGPGSKPGSGYCCSAERTRGRGKCFRGNGPRVGVCKLASVPAGQRRPRGWHGVLGPGGGAARWGRQREAAPGR